MATEGLGSPMTADEVESLRLRACTHGDGPSCKALGVAFTGPVLKERTYPKFPRGIRFSGTQEVKAMMHVDAEGKVANVVILEGAHPLTQAVEEAVRTWSFEPARYKGAPVPVLFEQSFTFTITGN